MSCQEARPRVTKLRIFAAAIGVCHLWPYQPIVAGCSHWPSGLTYCLLANSVTVHPRFKVRSNRNLARKTPDGHLMAT